MTRVVRGCRRHRFALRLRQGILRQRQAVRRRAADLDHRRPVPVARSTSPALTDFIIQTRKAHMFITGPDVIKQVTGEEGHPGSARGGADAHQAISGVTDFVADDDEQALLIAQKLLSFLPQNNAEEPPVYYPDDNVELNPKMRDIVPVEGNKGYDVRDVITELVDHGDFLEVKAGYATNIVTGFRTRINGHSVGFIANQPKSMSGRARHQRVRQGRPLHPDLRCLQHPGDQPGRRPASCPVSPKHGGIIRHGAKDVVRLLNRHCAEDHRGAAQGLRRLHAWRCARNSGRQGVRLAERRDRGDGRRYGAAAVVFRRRSAAPRIRRPSGSGSSRHRRSSRLRSPRPPTATWTTSSIRPTPVARSRWRWRCPPTSASSVRPRSTACSRSDQEA